MSVTGKLLYNKICELRPDLSSGISPEILSKVCEDPSTQPFLNWFCKNVSNANVLSNEETKLKNTLQNTGELLLEDETLDAALEEATRDCPDLLQLVDLNDVYKENLFAEYKALKESCKQDEEYLQTLRQSIKNLREIENKLDDDIEEAETTLAKEEIETEKAYDDCSMILKEFDKNNCQFSKNVDNLLNIYADAAKNQGNALLWSQMPIDLFIKQIELYNHYLRIYIRKEFGDVNKGEQTEDSDYASLIDDRDKEIDERKQELLLCKTNLTNSKIEEINASVQEESCVAMLQYVRDIYNGGVLKMPEDSKLQGEIQTLSIKRDFLEQNVELLRDQQISGVMQFAEMEIMKILKNDAIARLERRRTRLEKLKHVYSLAGEHGHVYVDLLCMLMEVQYRCLREVAEFIADARHYISTEYKLSSARCEIVQQQQDEYTSLVTQCPKTYNAFNQIFISMMLDDDDVSDKSLSSALKRYDDLIADNAEKKKLIFETRLNDKLDELQKLENKVNKDYMNETQREPTVSLTPVSYEISLKCEEISAIVQKIQGDITSIRNQFKERTRMDINLEREKDILWQRFLMEPHTLRNRYEEVKQKANESYFGDTGESKPN